jgi:hypothetical protein
VHQLVLLVVKLDKWRHSGCLGASPRYS